MPAEVGAPKTARPPVHLLAQQLGELSKNLGRLLLGERVLAVAELAAALPPSRRRWCWWEMIPEVHDGTRAASDARVDVQLMRRSALQRLASESLRGVQSCPRLVYCVLSYRLMGAGTSAASRRVAVLRDRSSKSSPINADTRGH